MLDVFSLFFYIVWMTFAVPISVFYRYQMIASSEKIHPFFSWIFSMLGGVAFPVTLPIYTSLKLFDRYAPGLPQNRIKAMHDEIETDPWEARDHLAAVRKVNDSYEEALGLGRHNNERNARMAELEKVEAADLAHTRRLMEEQKVLDMEAKLQDGRKLFMQTCKKAFGQYGEVQPNESWLDYVRRMNAMIIDFKHELHSLELRVEDADRRKIRVVEQMNKTGHKETIHWPFDKHPYFRK